MMMVVVMTMKTMVMVVAGLLLYVGRYRVWKPIASSLEANHFFLACI